MKKNIIFFVIYTCFSFALFTNGCTLRWIGMIYEINRLNMIGLILMIIGAIFMMLSSTWLYYIRKNKTKRDRDI